VIDMAKCPVCGMEVNESKAEFKAEHGDKTYYFCSEGCLSAFKEDPHKFTCEEHGHH
jgi:Cu+-exporting ATPase